MQDDFNPVQELSRWLNEEFSAQTVLDGDGVLHLIMPQGTPMAVALAGTDLVFYAQVAQMQGPGDAMLMSVALVCNLHQDLTRGGAVGLDLANQALVYSWRMPASEAHGQAVPEALDNFCQTSHELVQMLAESRSELSADELEKIEQLARGSMVLREDLSSAVDPNTPAVSASWSGLRA
jgi:hypothetical protein